MGVLCNAILYNNRHEMSLDKKLCSKTIDLCLLANYMLQWVNSAF